MPLDNRFPNYPGRVMGYLYGHGPSTVVLWADDQTVEESPEGSSTQEDMEAFKQLLAHIWQAPPPNMAVVHDAVISAGWEYRGTFIYKVLSDWLLVDAAALADMADELWQEREELLAEAYGRHPKTGSDAWPRWVTVTVRRGAAVRGARALGLAAVEALVNELLAAQHPEEYAAWEVNNRKGFRWKLERLLKLRGADPEQVTWFKELNTHAGIRNDMLHHRPEWIVDRRDDHSVAPPDEMTQELLVQTLEVVHRAIGGLFALYDVPTPDSHSPQRLRQITERPRGRNW